MLRKRPAIFNVRIGRGNVIGTVVRYSHFFFEHKSFEFNKIFGFFFFLFSLHYTSIHGDVHSNIDHNVFVNALSLSLPASSPSFYFCLHSVPVLLAQLYLSFPHPSHHSLLSFAHTFSVYETVFLIPSIRPFLSFSPLFVTMFLCLCFSLSKYKQTQRLGWDRYTYN